MVATFSTTNSRISVSSAGMSRRGRRAIPAVKSARNANWQAREAVRQDLPNPGSNGQEKTVKAAVDLPGISIAIVSETSGSKAAAHTRAAVYTATVLLKSVKTTELAAGKPLAEMILGRDGHPGSHTRDSAKRKGLSLTQDQINDLAAAHEGGSGKAFSRFVLAWLQTNAKVRPAGSWPA